MNFLGEAMTEQIELPDPWSIIFNNWSGRGKPLTSSLEYKLTKLSETAIFTQIFSLFGHKEYMAIFFKGNQVKQMHW